MKWRGLVLCGLYLALMASTWRFSSMEPVHSGTEACPIAAAISDCGCKGSCGSECGCCTDRRDSDQEKPDPLTADPYYASATCNCGPDLLGLTVLRPHLWKPLPRRIDSRRGDLLQPGPIKTPVSWRPEPPDAIPIA